MNKREKTAMKKKIANRKKVEKEKANKEEANKVKSKAQIARELKQEWNYEQCNFPLRYKYPGSAKNWFEFNDNSVTPVLPGTLQRGFGGNSTSAYMLVYRQRKLLKGRTGPIEIPEYWKAEVEKTNREDAQSRLNY